jgi:antitoxin HicB
MREIRYAYPARLRRDEDGRFVVSFPDLPEALTDGASLAEALAEAADCLSEALMSRIVDGEAIPAPSPRKAAQRLVAPDPTVALKAALHRVVRARKITAAALARRLRIDHKEARRLLDPRHPSKLPRLAAALAALDQHVAVSVLDAA